jgi:hypothetical protein
VLGTDFSRRKNGRCLRRRDSSNYVRRKGTCHWHWLYEIEHRVDKKSEFRYCNRIVIGDWRWNVGFNKKIKWIVI